MAEDKTTNEAPLIERWLAEQQQWQRTFMTYMDSMVKNEDFLVHLGNALRAGSADDTSAAITEHANRVRAALAKFLADSTKATSQQVA